MLSKQTNRSRKVEESRIGHPSNSNTITEERAHEKVVDELDFHNVISRKNQTSVTKGSQTGKLNTYQTESPKRAYDQPDGIGNYNSINDGNGNHERHRLHANL